MADRDKRLTVAQEADRVTVELPAETPDPIAAVLCLEHE